MKGTPRSVGTSKACRQCRTKRKKCDLKNPCNRCSASHSECSGPIEGALFVNKHKVGFPERSQRDVLQDALAQRFYREETSGSVRTVPEAIQGNSNYATHNMVFFDTVPTHGITRVLYASLLDDFCNTSFVTSKGQGTSNSIFNHSAIALCLRNLVTMGSAFNDKPTMLDLGVFSLLSLYFGKMRPNHHQLVDLSRRFYSLAVRSLYNVLSVLEDRASSGCLRRQQLAQNTFCLSLVLILFELVDAPTATTTLDIHVDGALSILQRIHPKGFEDSATQKQLLSGFRGIAYASAARRRLSLFLDEPQWLNLFDGSIDSNHIDRLYNIAIRLPRLLAQTNTLHSVGKKMSPDSNVNLLSDYTALKSMFQNWYLQQLSRNEAFLHPQPHVQDHSGDQQAGYKNMLHLSTMLIELDMGFSDLLSSFPQHSSFKDIPQASKHYETIDTQMLLATMASSVQSLCGSKEGQLVAAVPSETLKRYLDRGWSNTLRVSGCCTKDNI